MNDLAELDDHALSELYSDVMAEINRRALARGDLDALIEEGFRNGFDTKALPRLPWITSGMILCPGGRVDRSAHSHDCGFVTIEGNWVWESDWLVHELIRHQRQPRNTMHSVSLVPATDGLKLDVVYSTMRNGTHQARRIHSFTVRGGHLEQTDTRTFTPPQHR